VNKQLMTSISGEIEKLLGVEIISSPWAILLVQFSDQTDNWPSISKYEELFTSTGSGKLNMVDFFVDMSHGKIDLSGSRVFGPYTLSNKRADYIGNAPHQDGKVNRGELLDAAKSLATAAQVPLGNFAGVCVSCLGQVDLCGFPGGMAAICDTASLDVSGPPQEMGHGYGLNHSRRYGSSADYQDPWDVMSTYTTPYSVPNPDFTEVGPGLNAWNMRSRGWLDETRVWTALAQSWDEVVQLRPLHRRDLPGFLAAQIGQYLVEFRVPQRWDAAIPRACVLVHSFLGNHSYLMPAYSGSQDIVEGDKFVFGDPNYLIFGYYAAEVVKIDAAGLTATVKLHQRPAQAVPVPGLEGQVSGGVQVDGGGILLIGGKVIKVPPLGPARNLVEELGRYLQIETSSNNVGPALAAQRAALEAIVSNVAKLYSDARGISEQPPGYPKPRVPSAKTKTAE